MACPQRHRQEVLRLWWMKLGIMGPPPVLSTTYGTPLQSKPVSHRMPRLSVSLYLCLLFNHCNYLMRWFCNECFRDEDMEPQKRVCVTHDSPVSKKQVRIQTQAFRSKASVLSLCQMSCYGSMKLSTRTYGNNYRDPRQQLSSQPAASQWGTRFNLGGFHFPFAFQF